MSTHPANIAPRHHLFQAIWPSTIRPLGVFIGVLLALGSLTCLTGELALLAIHSAAAAMLVLADSVGETSIIERSKRYVKNHKLKSLRILMMLWSFLGILSALALLSEHDEVAAALVLLPILLLFLLVPAALLANVVHWIVQKSQSFNSTPETETRKGRFFQYLWNKRVRMLGVAAGLSATLQASARWDADSWLLVYLASAGLLLTVGSVGVFVVLERFNQYFKARRARRYLLLLAVFFSTLLFVSAYCYEIESSILVLYLAFCLLILLGPPALLVGLLHCCIRIVEKHEGIDSSPVRVHSRKARTTVDRSSQTISLPVGSLLGRIAEFLFSAKTFSRVFEPHIADMQEEWSAAYSQERYHKAKWIRVRDTAIFCEMILAQCGVSFSSMCVHIWKTTTWH